MSKIVCPACGGDWQYTNRCPADPANDKFKCKTCGKEWKRYDDRIVTDKKTEQRAAIVAHGENLLKIFPNATEQDPTALCKKLRRLEAQANAVALRLCNGPEYPGGYEQVDTICDAILGKVNALLGVKPPYSGNAPIFINRDPRGHALKIRSEWMQEQQGLKLERDWGGYGILAPEIS